MERSVNTHGKWLKLVPRERAWRTDGRQCTIISANTAPCPRGHRRDVEESLTWWSGRAACGLARCQRSDEGRLTVDLAMACVDRTEDGRDKCAREAADAGLDGLKVMRQGVREFTSSTDVYDQERARGEPRTSF